MRERAVVRKRFTRADAFLEALRPSRSPWSDGKAKWCFRGQRDARWGLVPSALRTRLGALRKAPRIFSCSEREEFECVQAFVLALDRAGIAIPHDSPRLREWDVAPEFLAPRADGTFGPMKPTWPPSEFFAALALAQHYGIKTRLLDWTYKPLVAAYFACVRIAKHRKVDKGQLAVWALRSDIRFSLVSKVTNSTPRFALVEAPYASNPNLAAQAGVFTLDRRARTGESLHRTLPSPVRRARSKMDPILARIFFGQP
jgi:hypothetical protein